MLVCSSGAIMLSSGMATQQIDMYYSCDTHFESELSTAHSQLIGYWALDNALSAHIYMTMYTYVWLWMRSEPMLLPIFNTQTGGALEPRKIKKTNTRYYAYQYNSEWGAFSSFSRARILIDFAVCLALCLIWFIPNQIFRI